MTVQSVGKRLAAIPGPDGFTLTSRDPRDKLGLSKKKAAAQVDAGRQELLDLQTRLYAEHKRALLVVLQGMDASGKDGTIKHVIGHFNPVDVHITSFKQPTPEELRHNFLWRIRRALPGPGEVGIFNRSHYEDVLVARVDALAPPAVIDRRYSEINRFEREAVDAGITIVKICLHISWEEQRQRMLERLERPDKVWKFSEYDLVVRGKWDEYQVAYDRAISRCSDPVPWYVVPADREWVRNWAITQLLLESLRRLRLKYPPASVDVNAMKARLGTERR
jgi:PPK2 family polyphosphate:nucleotide phosphotransferase